MVDKELNELLHTPLTWVREGNLSRFYYSPTLDRQHTFLRMNNFPEEPLWTIVYKGISTDLEDKPEAWTTL